MFWNFKFRPLSANHSSLKLPFIQILASKLCKFQSGVVFHFFICEKIDKLIVKPHADVESRCQATNVCRHGAVCDSMATRPLCRCYDNCSRHYDPVSCCSMWLLVSAVTSVAWGDRGCMIGDEKDGKLCGMKD